MNSSKPAKQHGRIVADAKEYLLPRWRLEPKDAAGQALVFFIMAFIYRKIKLFSINPDYLRALHATPGCI